MDLVSLGEQTSVDELLEAEAELGRRDLYYLASEILRFGEGKPSRPAREIEPICRWLTKPWPSHLTEKARRKRCMINPRGTLKTTVAQAYATQRILDNPNIRILYTSQEKSLSIKCVGLIMDWLCSDRVTALYGPQKGEKNWIEAQGQFKVVTRTIPSKDWTMTAGGIDCPEQGPHYDLIIIDDAVGRTNRTPEGIARVDEYLSLLWPVLDPGGELLWIATIWDYADTSTKILGQWKAAPQTWEVFGPAPDGVIGWRASLGDEKVFPHAVAGEPLFSIFTDEAIAQLKASMSIYDFSCLYENRPIPSEAAYFSLSDFQYVPDYDASNPIFQGMVIYMGVDPASGLDTVKRGDDTAIVIIGAKGQGNSRSITVLDTTGGQWRPSRIFQTMALLNEKWRARIIPFETAGPGKGLYADLKEWMQRENVYMPVKDIPHAGNVSAKADRIAAMEPLYRAHSIYHCEHLKGSDLELQLLRFKPGGAGHDDYPDALATAIEVVRDSHLSDKGQVFNLFGNLKPRYRSTRY